MAGRSAPTARRMRIAAELRKLRERAGLTATEAARLLGTSQGQLSNVETARFGVSGDRIRAMAQNYSCSDHAFIEALVRMSEDRKRGWWEEYREILPAGLIDLAELEHHARALRGAITAHIPGLLQTGDHAREIFRQDVPAMPPPEIEHRVSFRIKRQAVLYGDTPRRYQALVHEAALRIEVGGAAVARQQLRHLLDMSEHDHVTFQVIPFKAGAIPGSGQSVYYAYGPVPPLDTVHLDQSHGLAFLDTEAQLDKYRVLFDKIEAVALSPMDSRDLVHSISRNL
ncbi:helix-turn-helix transcriptional regulator [Streptomyces sp. NBC_01481]|uniref:helix-turn-helix domain-containing protein n=1 Tax=Streptomyces sp. NBC_01481 TaxID=2975869 RepID=UPI002250F320|nr:helix-turn-helix transcriptional regulator [Streptomyces sp. NBC_01481]MCX4584365.1 helix-turn-helix transcriptional regulator [Streptomyces sp. NBC_01481]